MIFVLNAALTAVATIVSISMVRDNRPTGDDEQSDRRSMDSEKTVNVDENIRTSGSCDIEKAIVTMSEKTGDGDSPQKEQC